MTTSRTASSSTDAAVTGGDPPDEARLPNRRQFFRAFGRQTVQNAGAVVGAAAELRRTGMDAARELMDAGPVAEVPESAVGPAVDASSTFRSPYRFLGDAIELLDQRELPARVATVTVRQPSEVASAMRSGTVGAGPVLAQVGAYAMAIVARSIADRPDSGRQSIRASAAVLRAGRRDVRALAWAVDRMETRFDDLVESGADSTAVSESMLAEAEAITSEAAIAHAAIGRLGAELLANAAPDPQVSLLLHGDMGPLRCGLVGMATALIQSLATRGRPVHAWVTEAAPGLEGTRITSLQLSQADVPHTVIPDSAVGWLLSSRRIDAVLLRGDRIAANTDTGGLIGSRAVAQLAAHAGVPVYVLAPLSSVDEAASDGSAIAVDVSSAAERPAEATPVLAVRLNPPVDVVPAQLIGRVVTEGAT